MEPVKQINLDLILNKTDIKDWLNLYAWCGTEAERKANVDCIMAQGDWEYLAARIDRTAGMHESGGGPEAIQAAIGFELSALYECHSAPHLHTCPDYREGDEVLDPAVGVTL